VSHSNFKKLIIVLGSFVVVAAIIGVYFFSPKIISWLKSSPRNTTADSSKTNTPAVVTDAPTSAEAKDKIKKDPPKKSTGGNISGSTKTNSDGTQTTTVSEGSVAASELAQVASAGPGSGAPYGISFVDETGQNGGLAQQIKDFMNARLKWGSEIPYLYRVTIRNAGASGWEGQYAGAYTKTAAGDIVSAYGYIILNTYYHQSDPYFVDYMKLVFAHEYGHHYTLYHKWVAWDIPAGQRFPDTYYTVRPLSKSNTAADYSLGWSNCDAEIIAEDYSYIYSGYGYHAMAGARGYPSAGTKSWLESIAGGSAGSSSSSSSSTPQAPSSPTDQAPTVSVTAPAEGATVSGSITISANASDDQSISKVSFYIGSTKIADDYTSAYQTSFNTASYANGAYQLKAVAYDGVGQTAQSVVNVTVSNAAAPAGDTTAPVVTIPEPTNPFAWSGSPHQLRIKFRSTDNVGVTKLKIYVNGSFWQEFASSGIDLLWTYDASIANGDYVFKAEAYDAAGNMGEASVTITKG